MLEKKLRNTKSRDDHKFQFLFTGSTDLDSDSNELSDEHDNQPTTSFRCQDDEKENLEQTFNDTLHIDEPINRTLSCKNRLESISSLILTKKSKY